MWNNVDLYYSKNMTGKGSLMGHYFFIFIVTILCMISPSIPLLSDKRLCADPDCSVVVSEAVTVSKYVSNDSPMILSFHTNENVKIFSKGAGSRPDLWGVEIAGKRGYVPAMFLKEKKIFNKNLKHEVPTPEYKPPPSSSSLNIHKINEIVVNETAHVDATIKTEENVPTKTTSIESPSQSINNQVSPSFQVIDGTTLDLSPNDIPKSDTNYATQIAYGIPTTIEQPILTAHPNLISNEATMILSGVSDQLPQQSVMPQVASELSTTESPDSLNNKKVTILTEDTPVTKDADLPNPSVLEGNLEVPVENNIHNNQISELGNEKIPEKSEITNLSNLETQTTPMLTEGTPVTQGADLPNPSIPGKNLEVPVENNIQNNQTSELGNEKVLEESKVTNPSESVTQTTSLNNIVSTLNKSMLIEPPKTEKIVEESLQISQLNELSSAVEEKGEQMITSTTSDSIIDVLSTGFNTVNSPSDVLSITTEMPMAAPVNSESVQEQITEPEKFVNDNNAETKNDVTPHTIRVDTATNTIDIVSNNSPGTTEDSITSAPVSISLNVGNDVVSQNGQSDIHEKMESSSTSPEIIIDHGSNFNEFPAHRNLLNVKNDLLDDNISLDDAAEIKSEEKNIVTLPDENVDTIETVTAPPFVPDEFTKDSSSHNIIDESDDTSTGRVEQEMIPSDVCHLDNTCSNYGMKEQITEEIENTDETLYDENNVEMIHTTDNTQHYWETLSYVALTAFTTLLFSLGYYYIENTRRDGQLIAKINKLEKDLLISSKECTVLDDTLKSTKNKLNSIEDSSFGSNEMVVALKKDLETACKAKLELEDQVTALEKDLESATEAGLELERMLREILATNSAENPLAKSVEDLQSRLNSQHLANESLTNALHHKTQENETLSNELAATLHKYEQLKMEVIRINENLKSMSETKNDVEKTLSQKIEELENQIKNISAERITLRRQLKGKEMEIKDLLEIVKQANINNLDIEKISEVSKIKADAVQLSEEKEELQLNLSELEGAHHLLKEHMKIINEEIESLREQCKSAEKKKVDAETRLLVLSEFFKKKEEERQKDEALWTQQQGEVSMTTERLQTMNNELKSYKQQIETLKREILDQEREYKSQITNLESKSHDQWVIARQNERRLEEAKAEASQLRNRLTLVEKNLSDNETDVKTHRLERNGETATSPQLFIGAEASSSPIMFGGSSNMPPPYLFGPPLPPFLPPPLHSPPSMQIGYDVGQRPPPLGGRLSSPPPMPVTSAAPPPPLPSHTSSGSRYEHSDSSPPSPPVSPSMLPPYGHFRSHPPPPLPFPNDRIHPPPPIPLPSMLPAHLSNTSWGENKTSSRNNGSFHTFHRDQRTRDYKGSSVPPEESFDKTHHNSKV